MVIVHLGAQMEIFYVALGSSMVWYFWFEKVGGMLKRVLYFFGDEPSLRRKPPILHLTLMVPAEI